MVDIMSAQEAFNESKYRKRADEILKEIVLEIKRTCEQGRFEKTFNINSNTEKGVIDLVINDLKEKGYKAVFTKDTGAAIEHYWDYITVNWDLQ